MSHSPFCNRKYYLGSFFYNGTKPPMKSSHIFSLFVRCDLFQPVQIVGDPGVDTGIPRLGTLETEGDDAHQDPHPFFQEHQRAAGITLEEQGKCT